MIYLSSDLHFNHDRAFIYQPRGFNSIEEMNEQIIQNFNEIITDEDELYLLGDIMLGGADSLEAGLILLNRLHGQIHIVRGNHDTDKKWFAYAEACPRVVEVENAIYLKHNGYHFYLSHYPTYTANLEKESLKQCLINLYGHTHQKDNFFQDIPWAYHIGVDSHHCKPVNIDDIIPEIKRKVIECKEFLGE